jgi:iron(III) transport system permease protein
MGSLARLYGHGLAALSRWSARRRVSPLWTVLVAFIVALVLLPVGAIVVLALGPDQGTFGRALTTVLPGALQRTVLLLLGVGVLTLVLGTITAWIVTMYRFPGRGALAWMLLLPLALPTYITAYCYVALLDSSGPIQRSLVALTGAKRAADLHLPDIRSLGGAIIILALVLYPYVYMAARSSFLAQSTGPLEAARTLGRSATNAFWSIGLPLARPALVAGVALAMMECLNDIGASEYLGVRTLTVTAYATWRQQDSLAAAARIAVIMLIFVLLIFAIERYTRGAAAFYERGSRNKPPPEFELDGWRAWMATSLCAAPFLLGFVVPVGVLLANVFAASDELADPKFWRATLASFSVAALAAGLAVALGLSLAYARRVAPNGLTRPGAALAGLGYALPGTVLAIGLLIPLSAFDNGLDALMRANFGISTGLLLTGSLTALVAAYVIRFIAIAFGTLEAGLTRISTNLDSASRSLGQTALGTLWRVHLPMLRAPVGAALLLVFVDGMKELPATLLLRPFNFETLATRVYAFAALEQFEQGALSALMIVLAGLVPLILINRNMDSR